MGNAVVLSRPGAGAHQRGMTLLVVLVFTLVIALTALVSMRGVLQNSVAAGAIAEQNQALAVDDVALQQVKAQVDTATAQGQPLELVQPDWLNPSAGVPDAAFWSQCATAGTHCLTLSGLPAGYLGWGTVQTTTVTTPAGCPSMQMVAVPYLLTVTVQTAKGVRSTAQAVYTKCFLSGQS